MYLRPICTGSEEVSEEGSEEVSEEDGEEGELLHDVFA
jgi:hypothetical protein